MVALQWPSGAGSALWPAVAAAALSTAAFLGEVVISGRGDPKTGPRPAPSLPFRVAIALDEFLSSLTFGLEWPCSSMAAFFAHFLPIAAWPAVFHHLHLRQTPVQLLCGGLVALHFLQKSLEVLVLHRYSCRDHVEGVAGRLVAYSADAAALAYAAAASKATRWSGGRGLVGVGLFAVGLAGSFWHQQLLRTHSKSGEDQYRLPRGGLFSSVACAHYSFELLKAYGLALVLPHAAGAYRAAVLTGYLAGRAHVLRRWYQHNVPDAPKQWRRLVIGIY